MRPKTIYQKIKHLENVKMLDEMIEDYSQFTAEHKIWRNKQALWKKWIRS